MVAIKHLGNRNSIMATSQNNHEISANIGKKSGEKYVRPKTPGDLWACSSYLARDLVPQYLQMGVISQTDAVALYITAGVVEFGRKQKPFYEPPCKIAKALGLPKSSVKTYIDRLIDDGVIARTDTMVDQRKERKWSAPGLTPPSDQPVVSSVVNTTLETEETDGGRNVYPDGDTPSSPGEGTACNPEGDTPCGLHLRESEEKESEEEKHIGKESPRAPSYVSGSSSFKKRSKAETLRFLKAFPWGDHQLDSPEGLASCWANLVVAWRTPSGAEAEDRNDSAAEIDPMEVSRAYMTLKQMRIYKTPETVQRWLEWYVKSGGLNKTTFITRFSKSWDKYVPIVAQEFVAQLKEEEVAWLQKLNQRHEREAGVTMPRVELHRGLGEDELRNLRESFLASLPDANAIGEAVGAVPLDADLNDDGEYFRWLGTLAKAMPVLGPYNMVPDSKWQLAFVRLAREDFQGDMEAFAEATRDHVVAMMENFLKWNEEQGSVSPRINTFFWRYYAEYFNLAPGIEEA